MKPIVLLAMEKWVDRNPAYLSPNQYGIVGSLIAKQKALAIRFCYDDWMIENPEEHPDIGFLAMVKGFKPKMIVLTHLLQIGDFNISRSAIAEATRTAPVVMVWLESSPHVIQIADTFADLVVKNIVVDSPDEFRKHSERSDRYEWLPEPRDIRIFHSDLSEVRDVALGFFGTISGRVERCAFIANLLANKMPIAYRGGWGEVGSITPQEHAAFLRRTMIGLNFTDSYSFHHMKGRMAETLLCGAMLLEQHCEASDTILEPFKEYVPFTDPQDLISKAIHYLEHPDERLAIAKAGQEKARQLFDGERFWSRIFEICGIE